MNCEHYQEMASRFADGELEGAGEAEMFTHLQSCETCRSFLRTAMQVRLSLVRDTPPVVPDSLDRKVSLISKQKAGVRTPVHFNWKGLLGRRLLVPAPAFAAAVLLLLASLGALATTLIIHSEQRAQMAANYIMLLPEVEVRGVYQAPSQNIR